jgi:hypothetical protein
MVSGASQSRSGADVREGGGKPLRPRPRARWRTGDDRNTSRRIVLEVVGGAPLPVTHQPSELGQGVKRFVERARNYTFEHLPRQGRREWRGRPLWRKWPSSAPDRRTLVRPGCGGDFWRAGAGPVPLPPAPLDDAEAIRCARALALAEGPDMAGLSRWARSHVETTLVKGDRRHPARSRLLRAHLRRARSSGHLRLVPQSRFP